MILTLQTDSGFQKLLEEKSKSSGPKVLRGLPIRQRAAVLQSSSNTPAKDSQNAYQGASNTSEIETNSSAAEPEILDGAKGDARRSGSSGNAELGTQSGLSEDPNASGKPALAPAAYSSKEPEDEHNDQDSEQKLGKSARAFWTEREAHADTAQPLRPRTPQKAGASDRQGQALLHEGALTLSLIDWLVDNTTPVTTCILLEPMQWSADDPSAMV